MSKGIANIIIGGLIMVIGYSVIQPTDWHDFKFIGSFVFLALICLSFTMRGALLISQSKNKRTHKDG